MQGEIKYIIIRGKGEQKEGKVETPQPPKIEESKIESQEIKNAPPTIKFPIKEERPIIPEAIKKPEIETEIEIKKEEYIPPKKEAKTDYKRPKIPFTIPASVSELKTKKPSKIFLVIGILIVFPLIFYGGYVIFKSSSSKFNLYTKKIDKSKTSTSAKPIITSIFKETTTTQESTTTQITSTIALATETKPETTTTLVKINEKPTSSATITTTSISISTTSLEGEKVVKTETSTNLTSTIATSLKQTAIETEKKLEPSSPKAEELKNIKVEPIEKQGSESKFVYLNLPEILIKLDYLTESDFKNKWINLIKIQKEAGSIYKIKFMYDNAELSADFVKKYFFNPSFIEEKYIESFRDSLGYNYLILFYYTYTRKFPVIIFSIKDDNVVVPFMRLWDKESILNDFKNIYLGLPKGKLIRYYTITQDYEGIKYKIAYFDNDYKFIWTIYNSNLIISTSLNAFKFVINKLRE